MARLKEGFEKRIPSRLLGSPGVTGVDATVAAWDDGQPWLDEILAQLRANRDWLAATLAAELPGVTMRVPEATYLAICYEAREGRKVCRLSLEGTGFELPVRGCDESGFGHRPEAHRETRPTA